MRRIVDRKDFWTATELRDIIYLKFGIKYTVKYCADLFHKWGHTMKVPVCRHVNAAADEKRLLNFRKYMRKEIARLEYLGYIVLMQDEAIFTADAPARRCVFSKIGARSTHVVSGTRQKQIVYEVIAINGKRIFLSIQEI